MKTFDIQKKKIPQIQKEQTNKKLTGQIPFQPLLRGVRFEPPTPCTTPQSRIQEGRLVGQGWENGQQQGRARPGSRCECFLLPLSTEAELAKSSRVAGGRNWRWLQGGRIGLSFLAG